LPQIPICEQAVLRTWSIIDAPATSWHVPVGLLLHTIRPAAQHLDPWSNVPSAVVSGVLVAIILAAARLAWHRTRVPSVLSRRVRRRSYLGAVRAESRRTEVRRLDVYAPRLQPAKDSKVLADIQSGWRQINTRERVRVLTLDLEDSLQAGAELLDKGIEVRVLPNMRDLGSDGLTFHLLETSASDEAIAIVNHHHGDAVDRPVRIKGVAPTEVFRSRFRTEWDKARPLEAVIAERIRPRSVSCQGSKSVQRSIKQAEATGLHLGARSTEQILSHLAFRDSCSVVFIIGLPGSGKSYVRNRLADRLASMRIECGSLSDYPYAYLDLVRTVLKLNPSSGNGFRAHEGGAFAVQSEKSLLPALQALHADVRDTSQAREVTLVEFARADLAAALQVFDDIRSRSQIIYVSAPADMRLARLNDRAVPPEIRVDGQRITLSLSDNHLLPTSAERALYAADGLDRIKASAHWRDRIFEIDNELAGGAHVDAKLNEFVNAVISPYLISASSTSGQGALVTTKA
jgi:hypothetical protein